MTPAQLSALQDLVQRDLTEAEQAAIGPLLASGNVGAIAEILSVGRTHAVSHFASERGILERYPGGPIEADALLAKLEGFAQTAHPMARIVGRALKFLAQPEGLDVGSPATRGLLDQLAAGGVITAAERDGLVAMATRPDPIHFTAVAQALAGAA